MAVYRVPAEAATQALALDANGLAGLKAQARSSPDQALSKAAGQFEALFLQMVLKQMREALPRDGPFDSDTMRSYTSMFDQQIAQHLSSRGVGLREALEKQLKRTMGIAGAPAAEAAGAPARWIGTPKSAPLTSRPPKAASTADGGAPSTMQAFIERLRPHAEAAAAALGVPAHLLLAQAGLETGWGRSQPRNADGSVSHNLFGIKSGKRWSGASVAAATTEFVQGAAVRTVERFRAYANYADAFVDAAKLLRSSRYAEAFANSGDAGAYAKSLQRAGYATDPQYADKLTRAIRMVSQHLAGAPSSNPLAQSAQVSPGSADNQLKHAAG
jgi:flagellar protein FlgJ